MYYFLSVHYTIILYYNEKRIQIIIGKFYTFKKNRSGN